MRKDRLTEIPQKFKNFRKKTTCSLLNPPDAVCSLLEKSSRINLFKNCLSSQNDFQSIKHTTAKTRMHQRDILIMELARLHPLMEQSITHLCTMIHVTTFLSTLLKN